MIILGSTGSIGVQALQIIKSQNLNIEVLCAGDNITLLNTQIAEFRPKIVVVKDSAKKDLVRGAKIVFCGDEGIIKALNIAESSFVLNALVGFSGVRPSLEAIRLGKTLALANKESLVVAGFLIDSADLARIIPVDSEHFALKELLDSVQSAESNNFCHSTTYCHSERSEESKKNPIVILSEAKYLKDKNRDSSLCALRSAQNDNFKENAESTLDSAESQNLVKNNPRASANLLKASSGVGEGVVREGEGSDFAIQAPAPSLKGNARRQRWDSKADLSAQSRREIRDSSPTANNNKIKLPQNNFNQQVKKMIITASGGAFRDLPLNQIPRQRAESALKHPNWAMGRKITIDSASMINKVFEILEAKWLFGGRFCDLANFSQSAESSEFSAESNKNFAESSPNFAESTPNIDAVIERTSTLHALIQMQNNALLAHFSANDMRLPIASALLGTKAQNLAFVKELDLLNLNVRFEKIDSNRYPLWELKDEVLKRPKIGAIINAANDILVERFLQNQIYFGDISRGIFAVLDKFSAESMQNIDEILEINAKIKDFLSRFKGFRH